jgi:hypothetical protein
MSDTLLSPELDEIDALIEQQAFEDARRRLQGLPEDDDVLVARVKLALREGSLSPELTMQRLTQLMKGKPELPGAKQLYQEASSLAYDKRASSMAHSHLPPPDKGRRE